MTTALFNILPFFGVVLIGWIAATRGVLTAQGLAGLNGFVFNVSLPPLLFLVMQKAPASAGEALWYSLAYGAVTLPLYFFALYLGRSLFKLGSGDRVVYAHLAVNGNTGFLGIPLALAVLGEEGVLPTVLILTFDIIFVMSLTTILLEQSRESEGIGQALKRAFLNPIILGVAGGLLWGVIGIGMFDTPLPEPITRTLEILGSAAAPAALFAVGATLGFNRLDRRIGEIGSLSLIKLIIHPVFVGLALAYIAPQTPDMWIAAALLTAAMPSSNNAVLFASVYNTYEVRASATVLVSTAISLITYTYFTTLVTPLAATP
ncbi:MAG: AEC family transporter [Neomegalonema sp.]|nr:AEC family transporter [Neomegalonema sp.]